MVCVIIGIEGMDGSGKSSIANMISSVCDFEKYEKLIDRFLEQDCNKSNKLMCKLYSGYSSNTIALYYLLGYAAAMDEAKNKDIVLDRGFISTYYFSYNEETSAIFDTIARMYGFPDITIILYASIEKRIERIRTRNNSDNDLSKNRIYIDNYDKFFEAIEKYDIPYLLINTDNLSLEQTNNIILFIIESLKEDFNNLSSLQSIFNKNQLLINDRLTYENICYTLNSVAKGRTLEKRFVNENTNN